jgi:hypothetical protein
MFLLCPPSHRLRKALMLAARSLWWLYILWEIRRPSHSMLQSHSRGQDKILTIKKSLDKLRACANNAHPRLRLRNPRPGHRTPTCLMGPFPKMPSIKRHPARLLAARGVGGGGGDFFSVRAPGAPKWSCLIAALDRDCQRFQ